MADKKTIAALTVQIKADSTKFQSDVEKATKRMKRFKADLKKFGTIVTKNFIAPLAAAGTAAIITANKAADYADKIDKTAIRTGLARDEMQKLAYVADQAGVNYSTIESSVTRLTRAMGNALNGSKRQVAAFKALRISVTDTNGEMRHMSDVFPEVIKGLSSIENETQRNALSMELFGRGALNLVPLLAALGENGIENLSQKATKLGLILSNDSVAGLVKYKDDLSTLKQQFAAATREGIVPFANYMSETVIPTVNRAVSVFRKWVTVPVSEKLKGQQTELNLLVKSLIAANTNEGARNRIIGEINQKYPNFLKGIDTEKRGLDDIKKRLALVNEQYKDRIRLMIVQEDAAEKEKKLNQLYREQDAIIKDMTNTYEVYSKKALVPWQVDGHAVESFQDMVAAFKKMEESGSSGAIAGGVYAGVNKMARKYKNTQEEIAQTEKDYEGILGKRLHMEELIAEKIKEQGDLLRLTATNQTNVFATRNIESPIESGNGVPSPINNPNSLLPSFDLAPMKALMERIRQSHWIQF